MRRLAKISILAAAVVSAIFFVDPSSVEAISSPYENSCAVKKIRPPTTDKISKNYLDFWSKFRDTVMPDGPQNNNPPKEMKRPPPKKSPAPKPRKVFPRKHAD